MKKSIFSSAIMAGVLALGLSSTVANASTPTASIAVSANVQAICLISATPLAFGTYNGNLNNATSNVNVTCTNTTPYDVGLDKGANGANVHARQMQSGSNTLNYALFSDSARTINWGNSIGTDAVHGTGSGVSQSLTIYGQIPAGQYVTPGAYSDTVTASINY